MQAQEGYVSQGKIVAVQIGLHRYTLGTRPTHVEPYETDTVVFWQADTWHSIVTTDFTEVGSSTPLWALVREESTAVL